MKNLIRKSIDALSGYVPGAGSWAGVFARALAGGGAYLLLLLRFGLAQKEQQFLADLGHKLIQSRT